MQQIGVDGKRTFALLVFRHGDLVLPREVDELLAALERPFAPGRDDLYSGLQRVVAEFEADLIVALARRAMTDGVGADFTRDLYLSLGD